MGLKRANSTSRTSVMLSHSNSSNTPLSSIVFPVALSSTFSKSVVVPELAHDFCMTSSTKMSTLTILKSPLCNAGAKRNTRPPYVVLFDVVHRLLGGHEEGNTKPQPKMNQDLNLSPSFSKNLPFCQSPRFECVALHPAIARLLPVCFQQRKHRSASSNVKTKWGPPVAEHI